MAVRFDEKKNLFTLQTTDSTYQMKVDDHGVLLHTYYGAAADETDFSYLIAYLSDSPLDIDELLHTLGLYEHRHKLPNQLSGGQQQRTSIGRAIVKNPDILLCDEPTGALDYHTSKEILKLIEDVNRKYGNTVIMVTHNDAIKNMADRVVKLRDGQIRKNYVNETKIAAGDLEW